MINRKCTNLNDSLAKAIERVCKEKEGKMKDYKIIEGFIDWFIKEQNDDPCQKDIMDLI